MSRTAHTVSFKITGKVGDVIYQRVRKGKGNIETEGKYDLQIRSIGQPIDPRTPAQVKTRERIAAAGYAASSSSEIIYGSGYPQTAFDWWMSDTTHRNEILNPYITDMGVGYAYNNQTAYGSYFTVDFASP